MDFLYIVILVVAIVQIGIFFLNRKKKKKDGVGIPILEKYNIKTRGDLFKIINSHSIPEEDRLLLEKHYQKQ